MDTQEKNTTENKTKSEANEKPQVKPTTRPQVTRRSKKKVCHICEMKLSFVDYKNVELLKRFITDRGKIKPARITGTCARHQRELAKAIKRARNIALI